MAMEGIKVFMLRFKKSSDLLRYLATQDRNKVPGGCSFATRKAIAIMRQIHLFFSESPAHDMTSQSERGIPFRIAAERSVNNVHGPLCACEAAVFNYEAWPLTFQSFLSEDCLKSHVILRFLSE